MSTISLAFCPCITSPRYNIKSNNSKHFKLSNHPPYRRCLSSGATPPWSAMAPTLSTTSTCCRPWSWSRPIRWTRSVRRLSIDWATRSVSSSSIVCAHFHFNCTTYKPCAEIKLDESPENDAKQLKDDIVKAIADHVQAPALGAANAKAGDSLGAGGSKLLMPPTSAISPAQASPAHSTAAGSGSK